MGTLQGKNLLLKTPIEKGGKAEIGKAGSLRLYLFALNKTVASLEEQ